MRIKKFQEGGSMPAQGAPAQQEQDPLMMLAQMAAEGLQAQDCQMMAQVCEGLLMLIEQAQGAAQAPVGQAPEGEPVFKKGGKIIVARKGCKSKGKMKK